MGFWSALGKIGAGIAAPFTGGASLAAIPIIDAIGKGATNIENQRNVDRLTQYNVNNEQDRLRLLAAQELENALQGRANIDLKQRQFQLDAPGQRAGNSVRGDILAGVQDAGISGPIVHTRGQVPQITGGLRPSLLSANTRQLGQNMSRNALLQDMKGDAFDPMPAPQIPTITPAPEAGGLDTALNWIGGISNSLGTVGPILDAYKKRQQVPQIAGPVSSNVTWPTFGGSL